MGATFVPISRDWVSQLARATLGGGARLVSRRRQTHERVRGMSEGAKRPSESAGEGVAQLASGYRVVVSIIQPPHA